MENKYNKKEIYRHYISVEWSKEVVALARMKDNSNGIVEEKYLKPDIKELKLYIKGLSGRKIVTIEESTSSQWLYVELRDYADKILICDPYRNSLIKEGPKNDKKDARTLCMLLRNGMLKEVYHSWDETYKLRKLASAYEDFVKASVRIQNQRAAIYQSVGKSHKKTEIKPKDKILTFILQKQEQTIEHYSNKRQEFEVKMHQIEREYPVIRKLNKISGIGTKLAFKIYSQVIDARRFENKYKYWSYCGLVSHEKESGNRIYGKKKTRCCRILKGAYKTAAMAALTGNNDIRQYYEYLLSSNVEDRKAKQEIARYIAKVTYAVMKYNIDYRPYQWRDKTQQIKQSA
jgi:hypothetical protein